MIVAIITDGLWLKASISDSINLCIASTNGSPCTRVWRNILHILQAWK